MNTLDIYNLLVAKIQAIDPPEPEQQVPFLFHLGNCFVDEIEDYKTAHGMLAGLYALQEDMPEAVGGEVKTGYYDEDCYPFYRKAFAIVQEVINEFTSQPPSAYHCVVIEPGQLVDSGYQFD